MNKSNDTVFDGVDLTSDFVSAVYMGESEKVHPTEDSAFTPINPVFDAFKRIKNELEQLCPNDKKEAISALKVYLNECDEPNNIYYNSWTRK